jgi:hypothetical protein
MTNKPDLKPDLKPEPKPDLRTEADWADINRRLEAGEAVSIYPPHEPPTKLFVDADGTKHYVRGISPAELAWRQGTHRGELPEPVTPEPVKPPVVKPVYYKERLPRAGWGSIHWKKLK